MSPGGRSDRVSASGRFDPIRFDSAGRLGVRAEWPTRRGPTRTPAGPRAFDG